MKRKWVKRSDVIILLMVIAWFVVLVWAMVLVTVQIIRNDYQVNINDVTSMVNLTVGGAVMTWLIKNMYQTTTANKLNPDYLKTHLPEDDFNT